MAEKEYLERAALEHQFMTKRQYLTKDMVMDAAYEINKFPAADVAPVRHGRWMLEAHDEKVNCRWNVTAECSECCDEKKEIWAGFFPGVPGYLAKDIALDSASSVKLSNFCPNCGAKMDLEGGGGK